MKTHLLVFIYCLSTIVLAGCGSGGGNAVSSSSPTPTPSASSGVTLAELAAAPQRVAVGTQTLTLSAYLYRDLMPTVGASDSSLRGSFTVSAADGSPLSGTVRVVTAYVVQNGAIGTFTTLGVTSLTSFDAANTVYSASGGPQWTPGSTAEAVVEVVDAAGNEYLLQTPAVPIIGAD